MTVTPIDLDRRRDGQDHVGARQARWMPTRAGILNVWRYYDEVFEFHRGRLLLRGANGSGKSKALEVLMPFLFDASLRPNRLSTFGTADRTMHWNLMGEGATGVTRVGYVWLEFGTGAGWFTCGARLQATAHTASVGVDYFTSTRRVGVEGGLRLVNDQGQPLTRAALVEALGSDGALHPTVPEYRLALRATLFPGMGEQRFDSLITALLQLRTPKLSQRLDPGLLSTLLSRALPPLDQADIAELAEGFERLDRQREELRHLQEVVTAAGQVAGHARNYARRVLRAAAAGLISATSAMDGLTRAARLSETQFQQVSAELAQADARHATLREQQVAIQARIDGLTVSEAYRQGESLLQLRRQTRGAVDQADRLRGSAGRLATAAAQADDRAEQQGRASARADALAEQARGELARCADRLALPALVPDRDPELDAQAARSLVRAGAATRTGEIGEVRTALRRHRDAVADRGHAEAGAERATQSAGAAQAAQESADHAYAAALTTLADDLATWAEACAELHLDVDALLAAIESATGVADVVGRARDAVTGALADERSALVVRLDTVTDRRDQLEAELEQCLAAVDLPPAAPPTRTADRTGRPGAPLWRATTFATGLPPELQAGIEAGLEASGLLDAWISPTGGLLDAAGHDVFALAGAGHPRAPSTETLASALVPEDDSPVPRPVVEALLARIALGDRLPATGDVAIGADGSWRLAALTGTFGKAEAGHIGAAARGRARERRIAQLRRELAVVTDTVDDITGALEVVEQRRRAVDEEARRRPGHEQLTDAAQAQSRAAARVGLAQEYLTAAVQRVTEAEQAAADALRDVTVVAAERGLPADTDALDRMDQAVADLVAAADAWFQSELAARQARELTGVRREAARAAVAAAAEATAEATTVAEAALELQARLDAVEAAVGSGYQQVIDEIDRAGIERDRLRVEAGVLEGTRRGLVDRRGELNATRQRDAVERDQAITARDAAGERVRVLAGGSLPQDAGIALELGQGDGVRSTLEAARAVAAQWPTVPFEPRNVADAHNRLLETLHATRDVLTRHADVELVSAGDAVGEVQELSAAVGGLRVGAAGLLRAVTAERDSSRDDITGSEHELFDTTLTGDTRRHLAARIRQAGELVDAMNARLDLVRTASDVAVRLTWQVDPALPAGTRAARELLLKDPVHLSEADRAALHAFFRQRIEDARAANTAMTWEQQLSEVFDYTAWHEFVVKVDRCRGAGWEVLTKKLHGALSGGEKAIALHLPLFAAIAAHYEAVPGSPRLILLDEVFVGVDTANRGQVFALLSALELDLLLTSDHEWCTYAELDGIAIHQLVADAGDGDDAVTSVRFTWDGRALHAEESFPSSDTFPAASDADGPAHRS